MIPVWVAGKTVYFPVTHGPYLGALETRSLYIKRYINSAVYCLQNNDERIGYHKTVKAQVALCYSAEHTKH